jgi:hypothetical protein
MKTNAQTQDPADAEAHPVSDSTTENHEREGEADGGRAAQNISLWASYLPPDCVKSMIAMGWDRTT